MTWLNIVPTRLGTKTFACKETIMSLDAKKRELFDIMEELCNDAEMDEEDQLRMFLSLIALEDLAIQRGRLIERGELPDETLLPLAERLGSTMH